MEDLPALPYFVPADELPEPLPSYNTIIATKGRYVDTPCSRVVRVGKHYVVKYGPQVSLIEGLTMLFVAAAVPSAVSVPKVYAIYTVGKYNFIVMEYVEGDTLASVWPSLSAETKKSIGQQLRTAMDALRSLPSPGYYGRVGRNPYEDTIFWTSPDDNVSPPGLICGPHESEEEVNNAMVAKFLYNKGPPEKAVFYRRTLPLIFHGHRPVFSHNDLQTKNLILRPDGKLTIIDWEVAGWYPDYWEYAMAHVFCGGWKTDFHECLAQALDPYPVELPWIGMLYHELWN
ncbi:hypothetical protein SCUCBS95973_000564 [Sporothrix curviconia]|uniref:Aminoglycoside phosphotransferase domain-containing protein n=1 Tax=Sporothrix curviconia TaxID=1260050 RepID=A0ABP0ARA9_9PEZI